MAKDLLRVAQPRTAGCVAGRRLCLCLNVGDIGQQGRAQHRLYGSCIACGIVVCEQHGEARLFLSRPSLPGLSHLASAHSVSFGCVAHHTDELNCTTHGETSALHPRVLPLSSSTPCNKMKPTAANRSSLLTRGADLCCRAFVCIAAAAASRWAGRSSEADTTTPPHGETTGDPPLLLCVQLCGVCCHSMLSLGRNGLSMRIWMRERDRDVPTKQKLRRQLTLKPASNFGTSRFLALGLLVRCRAQFRCKFALNRVHQKARCPE